MDSSTTYRNWLKKSGSLELDLTVSEENDWSWLEKLVPTLKFDGGGGFVPFQAYGTLEGRPFYMRDRHGFATLKVGDINGPEPHMPDEVFYLASIATEEFQGEENFVDNFLKLVPLLAPASYRYEFQGTALRITEGWKFSSTSDETEVYYGWGNTSAEAYASLFEHSVYLEERGAGAVVQKAMHLARNYSTEPLNRDERVYPLKAPDFRVTLPGA